MYSVPDENVRKSRKNDEDTTELTGWVSIVSTPHISAITPPNPAVQNAMENDCQGLKDEPENVVIRGE